MFDSDDDARAWEMRASPTEEVQMIVAVY